jgi:glycosyltransferase involved in cell wall biosynthesis
VDRAHEAPLEPEADKSMARCPSISVVIPALNEGRNLAWVLNRMPPVVTEVVLVDGNSTDDTVLVARRTRTDVRIVTQNRTGKGNAMVCGLNVCTGDIVVMVDADGSADPAEIPAFVNALTAGADYAKGSRFLPGGDSHDITRLRKHGNWMLNRLVNRLFGTDYTDLCYGYNAFWRRVLVDLELDAGEGGTPQWGDGFEIETIMNVRAAHRRLVITEVPSVEYARVHGVSNLNAWRDGWRVLYAIGQERRRWRACEATSGAGRHSAKPDPLVMAEAQSADLT